MALDRRLARELAPFGAATLLGFVLVGTAGDVDWRGFAIAAAMTVAIGVVSVLAPWRRWPRTLRVVPWLLFLLAVAILRDSAGGTIAGVGALSLVPVFWLALHGTRSQLLILLAGLGAFFIVPAMLVGNDQYTVSMWRIAVMFAAASALVGFAVQSLVARVRSHADALALREHDLEIVADLSRSLSLVTNARQRICAAACHLSAAQFAVLLEGRPDGSLDRTAEAGVSLPTEVFSPADSAAMTAYASGKALYVADADVEGASTVLFEPVHRGEEVAGVLVTGWREPPTDERRARGLVRLLASEAAFVIERADLMSQLTESALTDELTGLPNRRAWDERLTEAVIAAEPICVAILDLDFFKAYNDDHGHQAGDLLLKEVAAAWRAELRPTDTLARYGGEEFVVLLREHDTDAARAIVDRLRSVMPRGQSCSAGLARREADDTPASLLGRADEALYDAKRAGRNRSLIAA